MSEPIPPPTYDVSASSDVTDSADGHSEPQLLIVPTVDTVNFQKGYLGAEDERAAIEGELQIKGAISEVWDKVTVSLRTIETAFDKEIELGICEIILWSRCPAINSHSLFILVPYLNCNSPSTPETHSLDQPARVHAEVPRTIYQVGEPIPVYITIPPPPREIVVEDGLRLRNVKTELVQMIKVKRDDVDDGLIQESPSDPNDDAEVLQVACLATDGRLQLSVNAGTFRRILSFSFIASINNILTLPSPEYEHLDGDTEYASITQHTLLHSVMFQINYTGYSSSPFGFSATVQTNRYEDDLVPHYTEGEAGPSGLPHGAPPPFEERDAPPPFSSSALEASSSARLPTFLESEREIIIPSDSDQTFTNLPQSMHLVNGEGSLFGFTVSDVFDGHSEDMQRSTTPPPSLEMASHDTDVTQLADIAQPERAIEALGLVLTAQTQREDHASELPPPPPALDDPSDPPPSIDSDFRLPDAPRQRSPPNVPSRLHSTSPVPSSENQVSHGHAPPPYLVPENHAEHVTRPPPYVD
ncbi:hypothetical protein LENED_011557 [Lentinula edodes]|uniref:Uncharacterized protein n=1 Tax=Lentinula edodes TaxID=5353 RepID=A0A1Q3EQC7_LENED|nr:hypothetical protein LENED_011557 [Lentinula edodes]